MTRPLPITLLLLALLVPLSQAQTVRSTLPVQVYFSPNGGCTEAIVKEINIARSTILVQAYSFTSTPIAKALVEAHRRGVDVRVILDKSQRTEKYSSGDFLANMKVPTLIDSRHAIAHNKIMILDGLAVITGSFNFTKAAEENHAENLLVIRDRGLAQKYTANWLTHAQHSEAYQRTEGYSQAHRTPTPKEENRGGYVASKNSAVFHRADCDSVSTISSKNLVRYSTRDDAVRAGRRPCAQCNP